MPRRRPKRDGRVTEDGEEPRRRRRRGGRGRGRGRGHGEDGQVEGADAPEAPEAPEAAPAGRAPASRRPAAPTPLAADGEDADEDEDLAVAAPRAPRTNPFGSVWDSQIGTPASASGAPRAPLVDEEDFEEPEIPEYLIAEQRRGGNRGGAPGRGGGGARGGRSAYQSAMDRERYGRGSGGGGGINRYPDVSGRTRPATPPRDDRNYSRGGDRPAPAPAGRSSNEPWSDVPPELEAMLRAQVAQKPPVSRPSGSGSAPATATDTSAVTSDAAPVETGEHAGQGSGQAACHPQDLGVSAAKAPAKPRATREPRQPHRRPTAQGRPARTMPASPARLTAPRALRRRLRPSRVRTRKPAAAKASPASDSATGDGGDAAPKRRTTRKTTAPAEPV